VSLVAWICSPKLRYSTSTRTITTGKGANSSAASGLDYTKALVGTGWTISLC